MAMGQNPVPPVNIPIPTKIGSKMGGEFTYPKTLPLVLTHSHMADSQLDVPRSLAAATAPACRDRWAELRTRYSWICSPAAPKKWVLLKKPVPKWVALASGNVDQNLPFAPPV